MDLEAMQCDQTDPQLFVHVTFSLTLQMHTNGMIISDDGNR